jgi:hypothetical protein
MDSFVIVMTCGVACLPAWNDDLRAASRQTSETAGAVRRLSAEFESAQRSAFDLAHKAKTEAERKEADRAMPDRRKYAQRFLALVSESLARWVDRLGEDRVVQIRRLNPDRLMVESRALAEEISKENRQAGRIPDAKIEELRKSNARRDGEPARQDRVSQPLN